MGRYAYSYYPVLGLCLVCYHCLVILQLTASKFANPPMFPPPVRQEKPEDDDAIYTNQAVYKRPLVHAKSTPDATEKPRKAPPPKPKLPADLAVEIRSSRKLQSSKSDDVTPTAPSRYASLNSTSSRGSTPDPDIIPINVPSRNSSDYENSFGSVDYENTDDIATSSSSTSPSYIRSTPTTPSHEQKPPVPSRGSMSDKKPSFMHRERAETVGDVLSSAPSIKPRSMTVAAAPVKKHDYEEINDDIGEFSLLYCQ